MFEITRIIYSNSETVNLCLKTKFFLTPKVKTQSLPYPTNHQVRLRDEWVPKFFSMFWLFVLILSSPLRYLSYQHRVCHNPKPYCTGRTVNDVGFSMYAARAAWQHWRKHEKSLCATKPICKVGVICPSPDWDRVNLSEKLGVTAVVLVNPMLVTSLLYSACMHAAGIRRR